MKVFVGTMVFLLFMSYARADSKVTFADPKFHYGDCVKVTEGFYRGCFGRVRDMHFGDTYEVSLRCKVSNGTNYITQAVDAKNLIAIEEKNCE